MGKIYRSITELVGKTPLLELANYEKKHDLSAKLLVKLEYFNPNQSIKDRTALNMIEEAEKKGLIKPGDTLVETTSGNTGIGLAAIAATKGYKFRVYIQDQVSAERFQVIKAFDGNVSVQNFFQANISYTHNRADNNNTFSGLVNWNYGLHYQFRLTDNFKLLAGGLIDVNGGFVYNLRNTNNPASARAYVNLDASGMAIWHLKIKRYPMVLRYQVNLPVMGVMFSPHYGQSYYEIFSLGNSSGVIKFTSLHNQPSLRQMLSVDLPIGYTKMRFSYLADLQQSNVNNIKTHTYSHVFMVGFVKDLYRIRNKKGTALPSSVRAY